MTAYINKLKDKDGNQQLPITHERAVRDDNGTTAETKFQNLEGAMDRAYVAQSDNGMGRITLKKNMVSGVNTLTQSMMQATNTIYVIQYDFTLGEDITIPSNCVLEFDGGSISASGNNDTIAGTNTGIKAGLVKIFNTNVTIAGTWDIREKYPQWFGANNDGVTDCTDAFQKVLDWRGLIYVPEGNYIISNTLTMYRGTLLKGSNSWDTTASTLTLANGANCTLLTTFAESDGSTHYHAIENIHFEGNKDNQTDFNPLVKFYGWVGSWMSHVMVTNAKGCGLYVDNENGDLKVDNIWVLSCITQNKEAQLQIGSGNGTSGIQYYSDIYSEWPRELENGNIVPGIAIGINGVANALINQVHIEGSRIGIMLSGSSQMVSLNNYSFATNADDISNVANPLEDAAIYITGNVSNFSVDGFNNYNCRATTKFIKANPIINVPYCYLDSLDMCNNIRHYEIFASNTRDNFNLIPYGSKVQDNLTIKRYSQGVAALYLEWGNSSFGTYANTEGVVNFDLNNYVIATLTRQLLNINAPLFSNPYVLANGVAFSPNTYIKVPIIDAIVSFKVLLNCTNFSRNFDVDINKWNNLTVNVKATASIQSDIEAYEHSSYLYITPCKSDFGNVLIIPYTISPTSLSFVTELPSGANSININFI